MSNRLNIQTTAIPDDLPHNTRKKEIEQLEEFLFVEPVLPVGTDYIVTSDSDKDNPANHGRVFVHRDPNDNSILGLFSRVGGQWKRWMLSDADLISVPDNETILRTDVDEDTGQRSMYVPLGDMLHLAGGEVQVGIDGNSIVTVPHPTVADKLALRAVDRATYFRGNFAGAVTLSSDSGSPHRNDLPVSSNWGNAGTIVDNRLRITNPGVYAVSFGAYIMNVGVGTVTVGMWLRPVLYHAGSEFEGNYSVRSMILPSVTVESATVNIGTEEEPDNRNAAISLNVAHPTGEQISFDGPMTFFNMVGASEANPYFLGMRLTGWATPDGLSIPASQFNYARIEVVRVGDPP